MTHNSVNISFELLSKHLIQIRILEQIRTAIIATVATRAEGGLPVLIYDILSTFELFPHLHFWVQVCLCSCLHNPLGLDMPTFKR